MGSTVLLIVIGGLVLGGAGLLIFIGLRNPGAVNEELVQTRLEEFIESGEEITLEKLEMSQPITERIIFPLARTLGKFILRFTPQAALEASKQKIEMAGMGAKVDPTMLLGGQFVAALALIGGVILVFGGSGAPFWKIFLYSAIAGVLGYFLPTLLIQSKVDRRQKDIRRAMPDALDLLTVCVEAGLGFEAAIAKVAAKWESELSLAFVRVNREIQLGKPRRDALKDMSDRLGVAELTSFVAAIIQSEQLGVSLAKVLRIQSDQMRVKRRQNAEQEAHKAPTKMLFPMLLLIFPSLIIILITPAILQIAGLFLGGE